MTGLVPDRTGSSVPASIAGVGMALAAAAVGVERGWVTRDAMARRVRTTLRFLWSAPQGPEPDAAGWRGFFYHFLDLRSGRRVGRCELSTMDTALLVGGALVAATYLDGPDPVEREARELATSLYRRVDWDWARAGGPALTQGWTPERGFLPWHWTKYTEALPLYVLALGSPTSPVPASSYAYVTGTYRWRKVYGIEHVHAGSLFVHQIPHLWLDLRGLRDGYLRERDVDWFENSRRATYAQRAYAIRNPRGFEAYGPDFWGISASDGPGPAIRVVDGVRRRFYGYHGRGVPFGIDDGTIAPWSTVSSLPFAPEIVLPAIRHITTGWPDTSPPDGLTCAVNPTFPGGPRGWCSPDHYSIDQGAVVLMIENARSGLPWRLSRRCAPFVDGLIRAGFVGGWIGR